MLKANAYSLRYTLVVDFSGQITLIYELLPQSTAQNRALNTIPQYIYIYYIHVTLSFVSGYMVTVPQITASVSHFILQCRGRAHLALLNI